MNNNCKEEARCILCGRKPEEKPEYNVSGFQIHRCDGRYSFKSNRVRNHQIMFPSPRLNAKQRKKLYNQSEISSEKEYKSIEDENNEDFKMRMKTILRYINKKDKMLDVGCNIGGFMESGIKAGFKKVIGIDINENALKYAQEKKLEVTSECLLKFKGSEFDLITMNDYIEHTEDPYAELMKCSNILRENGIIFITTPDTGSIMRILMGKRWIHWKPEQHLFLTDRKTICSMLEECGFEILTVSSIGRTRKIGKILEKGESYSKLLVKILGRLLNHDRTVYINLFDEMMIIARKK
jgi:2-polyprenyl-3-methyl-5-hydroxy-6-metoxy-1,4-benzoquinol methylase